MTSGHRWAFKARFRAGAYGWRGSALAGKRLKEAVGEIKSVAKSDGVLAAEGCVSLMERLWPALEHIDTSSGALGGAVHRTLDELIPILVSAPADVMTRSAWLERLFQAVMDDGVEYLAPVEDRWGEIAVYPELMAEYAERLRALIRRVWVDEPPGGHVVGTAICLSCLLESGRYGDLIELLACARTKWWHWHRFGAEALARQGHWDAAMAYADGCRSPQGYNDRQIDRFCEDVLIKSGRADDAYRRYGLKTVAGPTYVAVFRETIKRYPDRDRRQVPLAALTPGLDQVQQLRADRLFGREARGRLVFRPVRLRAVFCAALRSRSCFTADNERLRNEGRIARWRLAGAP